MAVVRPAELIRPPDGRHLQVWHRGQRPDGQHAFIARLAGTTTDEAVALLRPDFLAYEILTALR